MAWCLVKPGAALSFTLQTKGAIYHVHRSPHFGPEPIHFTFLIFPVLRIWEFPGSILSGTHFSLFSRDHPGKCSKPRPHSSQSDNSQSSSYWKIYDLCSWESVVKRTNGMHHLYSDADTLTVEWDGKWEKHEKIWPGRFSLLYFSWKRTRFWTRHH